MAKDLNYYMGLNYKIEFIECEEEEGYAIHCPELTGCITYAKTLEEGFEMIEDAKKCWFTACLEDGIPIPEPNHANDYNSQFKVTPMDWHY